MNKFLNKLSITQTIIFLSVFLFCLQLIYAVIINSNVNIMGHHISKVETQYIPLTKYVTLLTEAQLKQEIAFERAFRFAQEIETEPSAVAHYQDSVEQFSHLNEEIEEEIKEVKQSLNHDIELAENEESKAEFKQILSKVKNIEQSHEKWQEHANDIFTLLTNQEQHKAIVNSEQVETEATLLEESVTSLLFTIEELSAEAIHNLRVEEESIFSTGILMSVLGLLATVFLTRSVTGTLNKNLDALHQTIVRISNGDLMTKVTDKLGKEFGLNKMRQHLHSTLLLVESSAQEMSDASNELEEVSGLVMKNVNHQAQELELVSSAMNEMEATSLDVARNAANTQYSTESIFNKTNESIDITNSAMTSMLELTNSLEQSSTNIQTLEKDSSNINSVIEVIKGIADQTNLLALNAAIEAARAGEQGRGFAVVADEVRTLAKRTQDSTVEIEEMISSFVNGTSKAVDSMEVSANHGNASHKATTETHGKIGEIQQAVAEINEMNNQVATAAEQQSATSQELSKSTNQISQLTSDNVISITRVSTSSVQLSGLSRHLQEKLSQFILC